MHEYDDEGDDEGERRCGDGELLRGGSVFGIIRLEKKPKESRNK